MLSLFNNNHLYGTGQTGRGLATASNIWRNNLGCYATVAEITDPTFRNRSRKVCPHLVTAVPNRLDGASCDLEPTERPARYRGDDHRKVFRIDPETREHFVYDPTANYTPLVLAPSGKRLPIVPLVVALYHDSIIAADRTQVDLSDFIIDFDFAPAEGMTYFDDDPALPEHAALSAAFPGLVSWKRITVLEPSAPVAPTPLPGVPLPSPITTLRRPRPAPAIPIAVTPTAPPAGGHWWDAEQAVRQTLEDDGWMCWT